MTSLRHYWQIHVLQKKAEIFNSAIVVIGTFNSAIFSPDWLCTNGLIGDEDAEAARQGSPETPMLVSEQVSSFATEWFSLQVMQNRFSVTSKGPLLPALKDLAASVFQLVPHTPVAAVGLNFMGHFRLPREEDFYRAGDRLAPKEIWNSLFPNEEAGLNNLTIRIQDYKRGEVLETKDEKRITVEPSNSIPFGIYMSYNGHHDVTSFPEFNRAVQMAALIDDKWDEAWQDALRVFADLLDSVLCE